MASTRAHKYVFSIWYAARHGRQERVEELVERDGIGLLNSIDTTHGGLTPLHWSSKFGHVKLTKWLLQRGANPSAVADNGSTPLHLAAGNSTLEMVRLLLEYAAEPRLKDSKGDTAAEVAKTYRRFPSEDLIRRWVPCGGFPDMRSSGFEFQRVDEHSLRFTLPPPKPPPKPRRPLEWMTPAEADTEESRRDAKAHLSVLVETLKLKEQGLGKDSPSVGISLLRMGRCLRLLGLSHKKDTLKTLHRALEIFEAQYRKAQMALHPPETRQPNGEQKNVGEGADEDGDNDSSKIIDTSGPEETIDEGKRNMDPLHESKIEVSDRIVNTNDGETATRPPFVPAQVLPSALKIATQRTDEYATVLKELASVYVTHGHFVEAEKYTRRAVRILSIQDGDKGSTIDLAGALTNLALLLRKNRTVVTDPRLKKQDMTAVELKKRTSEEDAIESERKEIDSLLLRALVISEENLGPNHLDTAEILIHISRGHMLRKEFKKAAVCCERALGIIGEANPNTEQHAKLFDELAESYFKIGRFDLAEKLFQNALEIREALHNTKMIPDLQGSPRGEDLPTIPIVEDGTDDELVASEKTESKPLENLDRTKGGRLGAMRRTMQKVHEADEGNDPSVPIIMRAEAGTVEGKKRIISEEEKKQVPFSKGYVRRKPEDYEYEEVTLIHPDVRRTFNNLAIASNEKIKVERKLRRTRRASIQKYRAKVDRVRRKDDRLYLSERPLREAEGVYSGTVGGKSAVSTVLDEYDKVGVKGQQRFKLKHINDEDSLLLGDRAHVSSRQNSSLPRTSKSGRRRKK